MKKKFLLSVLIGILFLFGTGGDVFADTTEKTIKIYTDESDGYVTSWVKETGYTQVLWDKAHDALEGSNTSSYIKESIEIASGWASYNGFYIHRALLGFDLSIIPESANIISSRLNVFPSRIRSVIKDEYSYLSLVLASNDNNLIDKADYASIGERELY